ncbi:hypothetical protein B1690_12675 [Geobacillus sp. 46C-IIa]|nr:hypothetical protein B1690_12675 [Geobacillus sp. 46C-IIa]
MENRPFAYFVRPVFDEYSWLVLSISKTICVSALLIGATGLRSSFSTSLLSAFKEPLRMVVLDVNEKRTDSVGQCFS